MEQSLRRLHRWVDENVHQLLDGGIVDPAWFSNFESTRSKVAFERLSGVMDNARGGRQWSLALARGQSTSELAMPVDTVQPVAALVSGSSARFSAEHLALAERLHQQMEPLLSKCLTQISPEALAMERRIGELTELEQLATNRGTPELMDKLTEVRQQLRLVSDDRRKLIANARPVQAGGGQLVGIESVGKR